MYMYVYLRVFEEPFRLDVVDTPAEEHGFQRDSGRRKRSQWRFGFRGLWLVWLEELTSHRCAVAHACLLHLESKQTKANEDRVEG